MSNLDVGALQSGAGLDVGALQSGGTTLLTVSVSDSYTISDAVTTLLIPYTLTVSTGDTLSFSDSVSLAGVPIPLTVSTGDSISFSDSLLMGGGVITENINDSLSFSDAATIGTLQPALFFSDTLSFSDAFITFYPLSNSFSDALSFSDSASLQNLHVYNVTEFDGINVQDQLTTQINVSLLRTFNDTISLSDSVTEYISIPYSFGDQLGPWLDYVFKAQTNLNVLSLVDFFILSDNFKLDLFQYFIFSESLSFTDTAIVSKGVTGSMLGDSYSLNDSITISLSMPHNISVGDSLVFSDAVSTPTQQVEPINTYLRRYLNDVV